MARRRWQRIDGETRRRIVRLASQGLDDSQNVTQIEVVKIVLVPVGLAILPQRLPALLGVPSEHFKTLTEGRLLFRVEMRSLENVR